jgi:ligand-binding sensor domain-containing protein/signal transduction histidine kinase
MLVSDREGHDPPITFVYVRARLLMAALLVGLLIAGRASALESGKAINQFPHRSWQAEHGLPQNSIFSLVQTPDGYLWAGTLEGLVRFDGVRFTVFDEMNTPELADPAVRRLAISQDGTLWIGTERGLTRMRDGVFSPVLPESGTALQGFTDLLAASDGSLWIATLPRELFQLSGSHLRTFTARDGFAHEMVRALAEDSQGAIWAGSAAGLQRWDGKSWTAPLPVEGKQAVAVSALVRGPDGMLWVGTDEGDVYRLQEGTLRRVPEASLPGAPISSLLVDRAGTLWVGSQGRGPLRVVGGQRSQQEAAPVLAGSLVLDLLEDSEGNLWIGTEAHGLHRLKDAPFTPYGPPEGMAHEMVTAIHEARDGSLWFATWGGGVTRLRDGQMTTFTTREGLLQDWVTLIAEGSDGSLWFGSTQGITRWHSGRFTVFSQSQGAVPARVRALHEDTQGTLWVGTEKGLMRWNGKRFEPFMPEGGLPGEIIVFLHGRAAGGVWVATLGGGLAYLEAGKAIMQIPEKGPLSGMILTLQEDAQGTLWIGTLEGLYRWKEGSLKRWTRTEGLFDNRIFQILPDGRGQLWMSCNKGIFRVSQQELEEVADGRRKRVESIVYGTEDGMRSAECTGGTSPAGIRTRNGRLWFPTIRGAVTYDLTQGEQRTAPPRALIEQLRVDGRVVPPAGWGSISPEEGSVEIHYTSPGLGDPQSLHFRYQLEGIDVEPVEAGPRRVAYYTHLPPGHYRFQVMAQSTEGGLSSPLAELRFYLQPRFHQTLLFRVVCALAAVLAVAGGVWLRLHQSRMREHRLQALVDERTAELATRLRQLQQMQEQIIMREKLASLGAMAAGIAHEIRNPLNFIISFATLSEEIATEVQAEQASLPEDVRAGLEDLAQNIRRIHEHGDRANRIVNSMLAHSSSSRGVHEKADLHTLLDQALELAQHGLSLKSPAGKTEVVREYDMSLGTVDVVPQEICRVFLNVLNNACDSMQEKQKELGDGFTQQLRLKTRRLEQYVEIRIRDNGKGVPSALRDRIFEPFFTTKPTGMGVGLGLSLSFDIVVKQHGGLLTVESQEGEFAEFVINLPH